MQLNRKRPTIFYGWWIVGATFLINLFTSGMVFFGFTAFFEPIVKEFRWSYTQVSFASSLRGLEMGLLSPVAGLAVDRFGPRTLVFTGALFLGIGMVFLSQVNTLATFYGAFILISVGISACAGVVTSTAVANWFRRKASISIGITMSGTAVGGLMVILITRLIDVLGWRMSVLTLGLWICVLNMALSLLLRHKPEQYGYLPDGAEESLQNIDQAASTAQVPDTETKIRLRHVLVSRTFWHISISYMLAFMSVTSVLTHIMPYLSSIGIARGTSSLLASAVPVVTIFGRLSFGWLGDRFNKRRLAVINITAICLGVLLFGFIDIGGIWLALPFIILFSVGWGGGAIMLAVLVKTYFSGSSFGTILGFVMLMTSVGQMLGPTLAGWVFDMWGSYQSAWFGFAIIGFIASIIIATTPQVTNSLNLDDIH